MVNSPLIRPAISFLLELLVPSGTNISFFCGTHRLSHFGLVDDLSNLRPLQQLFGHVFSC